MSHNIKQQLREARPKLRVVSPMSSWVVKVMGWFNIILGLSLVFSIDSDRFTDSLFLVNEYMSSWVWGCIFLLIGIVKLYSLACNSWSLARKSLMMGVAVKAAWMVALTVRTFFSPDTTFLNLTWVAVGLVQMGAYVWFMPPNIQTNKQRK